ncbi:glycosylphosphatidylinositol anchor biosynthesis [Claviceps cyperi]|nr:glycosylphosphatidylinositol anchor biosynthesis [Claviceps cyperi]
MAVTTSDVLRHMRNRPMFLRNLIIIRLINAWWISTFFQPDEYFQSLEPAWELAFGPNSGAWLTWEWNHQLRSSLHPVLFSAVYLIADWASKLLPSGSALRAAIVIGSPKVLQAVCAGICDYYTWQLAVWTFGPNSNKSYFALFLQLFNPWQWYCSTRTFSNSLEATLTIMALYYWPWRIFSVSVPTLENSEMPNLAMGRFHVRTNLHVRISLCLAAFAVILRPTNILIWATLVIMAYTRVSFKSETPTTRPNLFLLAREVILCGSLVLSVSAVFDYFFFGFWTFPPYNWLNFNISKSLAVFYGRNPWHYYLSQGLPLLCTTSLPFALAGLLRPLSAKSSSIFETNTLRVLSCAVFTTIAALSSISHKEVRFIYPLLPMLSIIAAPAAASFFTTSPAPKSANPTTATTTTTTTTRPQLRNKSWLLVLLGTNIILAGYLSFLHQPAPLNVLSYLRKEYQRIHPMSVQLAHTTHHAPSPPEELFALFLMPCHSTPWRSHLYYPGLNAYALACEPPLHTLPDTPERKNYRDEADRFYDNSTEFLKTELFVPERGMRAPRYIIGFEGIEPSLLEFLASEEGKLLNMKLRRVWSGFNGFFNEDWRRSGRMLVWDTGLYGNAPMDKGV